MENINPNVKIMEYAVRGPLVIRATQIEKELEKVITYWFYDFDSSYFSFTFVNTSLWMISINICIYRNELKSHLYANILS